MLEALAQHLQEQFPSMAIKFKPYMIILGSERFQLKIVIRNAEFVIHRKVINFKKEITRFQISHPDSVKKLVEHLKNYT